MRTIFFISRKNYINNRVLTNIDQFLIVTRINFVT